MTFFLKSIKNDGSYYPSSLAFIRRNLRRYDRQYFGYINKQGEKVVSVFCFLNSEENTGVKDEYGNKKNIPDWYDRVVFILDGGASFWQIKINLNTKKVIDFSINGMA